MALIHTDPRSSATQPSRPALPHGWRYSDEVETGDAYVVGRHRRRLALFIVVGVAIAVAIALLLVLNAQRHYSQGVVALEEGRYSDAVGEFSSADLLVIPYRDAAVLADEARGEILEETAGRQQAQARVDDVTGALTSAEAALQAGSGAGVVTALRAVSAGDLKAVLREDSGARQTADALAKDLTTEGRKALGRLEWGRAGRYAAALLLLDPSSVVAGEITTKAAAGEKLSAKLAAAKAAARDGQWRNALRLALAVQAAHKGFPGAASLVADAREALKPKPKPTAAATVTAPTTSTTTSGGTSTGSGGSSGGSSGPAPP